jgi:hypothetical protein
MNIFSRCIIEITDEDRLILFSILTRTTRKRISHMYGGKNRRIDNIFHTMCY